MYSLAQQANPLITQVVRHLPFSQTIKDRSFTIAPLMKGTWVGSISGCVSWLTQKVFLEGSDM